MKPDEPEIGPPLIGALMRMPVDAVRGRMLAALHANAFTDLIPAHLVVLGYPGPENQRPSDLAVQTGMSKQALNYLLGQMEQAGYLVRREDPDDQRSKRVRLTKRGQGALKTMRDTVRQVEKELEAEMGRDEFAQLRFLLTQLNATALVTTTRQSP
jgi:DNA-binding MarR family transcriptional regulator